MHDPRGLDTNSHAWSIIGVIVHHSVEEVFCFDRHVAEGNYTIVSPEFREIEVPMGCNVPVGLFLFLNSSLMATETGSYRWVVFA